MGSKVLIVDDDDELHILYGLYLRGESFTILEAFNGEEAFTLMEKDKPDLIVLDMIMPVMDGETFLRTIQGKGELKKIPVIIASVNDKIPAELLKFGNVRTVLRKPFTIQLLSETIQKQLAS